MAILKYIGPRLSTGEPERSLNYDGIPAGDLDPETLDKEQLSIVKRSGLYDMSDKPKPSRKPAPNRSRTKPAPASNSAEPAPDSESTTEPADSGEKE